jgi:hypothetical protein
MWTPSVVANLAVVALDDGVVSVVTGADGNERGIAPNLWVWVEDLNLGLGYRLISCRGFEGGCGLVVADVGCGGLLAASEFVGVVELWGKKNYFIIF